MQARSQKYTHTHIKTKMSQKHRLNTLTHTHTRTNPKPVFPACVRNDCQEAGVSHKPCSQETKADNQIETFCVSVYVCVGERGREVFFSLLCAEYK